VRNSLTTTVINGEAIPVIHNRIEDAGFGDLDVCPLGTDRVFLSSTSGKEVSSIIESAQDFFAMLFSNILRWDCLVFRYTLGMRIFSNSVLDCGRFLWTDNSTLDKFRFDYARVLIATSSLEVVNCVENIIIGGEIVEIKIVEEWGFNMGDDVCLFDTDDGSQSA